MWQFTLLSLLLGVLSPAVLLSARIELQGEVQCLGPEGPVELSYPCPGTSELVFVSKSGERYRFSKDDPRVEIFRDERVRTEPLQILAEIGPEERLSLLSVHIRRDGQLIEPHYFCQVCNITAYAPGPCWCCQAEFEYREKVLTGNDTGDPPS